MFCRIGAMVAAILMLGAMLGIQMKTLKDYFDKENLTWFRDNTLEYKLADVKTDKGELLLLYNDKFCLKLYDRMGHGFSVTVNVSDRYDESIYENDKFSLSWAFKYFGIRETASFSSRKSDRYLKHLPRVISDIKAIVPRFNKLSTVEWQTMIEWMTKEATKRFS